MIKFIKVNPQIWVQIAIFIFIFYIFIEGIGNSIRYNLFPFLVAGIILVLSCLEWVVKIVKYLKNKDEQPVLANVPDSTNLLDSPGVNESTIETTSTRSYYLNVLWLIGWMIGALMSTWFIGIGFTVPLFLVLFLLIEAKLSWIYSILISASVWLIVEYVFIGLLRLQVPSSLFL